MSSAPIPLCEPNISGNEWARVKACLDSGWVSTSGEVIRTFEQQFANIVGAAHGVAVSSGTAALHLALHVAGVNTGEEVLVPGLSFVATANVVRYLNAWPTFIDVDSQFGQLDPMAVSRFCSDDCQMTSGGLFNRHTGRRIAALLPVDLLGHPADLDALRSIASEFKLRIVEDATQALGACYKSKPIGSHKTLACFSFNGNKLITTGGGGMLVTDDESVAARAKYLSTQARDDARQFIHREIGFNYRLTNIQAAIGCAQLERLPDFLSAKKRIAAAYREAFAGLDGISLLPEAPWADSAYWLSTVRLSRPYAAALRDSLDRDGIETRMLWQPLHLSPAHADSYAAACPNAERWVYDCLSLPSSTGLTASDQARVIDSVRRFVNQSA